MSPLRPPFGSEGGDVSYLLLEPLDLLFEGIETLDGIDRVAGSFVQSFAVKLVAELREVSILIASELAI